MVYGTSRYSKSEDPRVALFVNGEQCLSGSA